MLELLRTEVRILLSSKCLSPISFLLAIRICVGSILTVYHRHYGPCSAAATILEFETLFSLKQSEVHLLFTFENYYIQNIYTRFSVETLLNLFRSPKESTNISVILNSYASETPTSYSNRDKNSI